MKSSSQATPRRNGVTAVHSLDRFVFTVPDLDEAQRFYSEFGLEARREGQRLDLHTHGHSQHWGSIFAAIFNFRPVRFAMSIARSTLFSGEMRPRKTR